MKRNLLIALFILVLPLTFFITHKYYHQPKTTEFRVPTLSEQPTDTLVMEGAIPIHHWETDNGASVYFVPTEKLPIFDIYISFDAGSARDGALWGLASFCGSLLEEGTRQKNAEQIAEIFENVGAEFDTQITRDRFIVTLRSLSFPSSLNPVIDILGEILAYPSFPEVSIDQIKNQTLMELKRNAQEPTLIAAEALYKAIYPNHPYGHLISGTPETLKQIKQSDLVQFHQQYFVSKNASITIVGGISRDEARAISNRLFAQLPQGQKPQALPKIPDPQKMEPIKIPFASSQTHVLFGQSFNFANEQEFFALTVGNYILGEGALVARLFKEIRNKRGLVYTVGSNIRRMLDGGLFISRLQTKSSQSYEALKELKNTLKDFRDNGPTPQEVEDAKRGIIGAFPLAISTNARIAEIVSEMTFYNLPLNYLNEYVNSVQNVTQESIQKAFYERLDPDKMALVLVGENLP